MLIANRCQHNVLWCSRNSENFSDYISSQLMFLSRNKKYNLSWGWLKNEFDSLGCHSRQHPVGIIDFTTFSFCNKIAAAYEKIKKHVKPTFEFSSINFPLSSLLINLPSAGQCVQQYFKTLKSFLTFETFFERLITFKFKCDTYTLKTFQNI